MELSFASWMDFESFCCDWLTHTVQAWTGRAVTFTKYGGGRGGEAQAGIDIVPAFDTIGIVGQAKHWRSEKYTWNDVVDDLDRTDAYPRAMTDFVIMTTAARHISVQNMLEAGRPYEHTSPNGRVFRVVILYTSDLTDIPFLDFQYRRRFFPDAFIIAGTALDSCQAQTTFAASLTRTRTVMPRVITPEMLDWLGQWDFRKEYVPEQEFSELYDVARAIWNVNSWERFGMDDALIEGHALDLAGCLPAARRLFEAVVALVENIQAHVIGKGHPHHHNILTLDSRNGSDIERQLIARHWTDLAGDIISEYRHMVGGESL
ncbi:hypothetical protein KR767_18860 [Luteibacter anthropi]|uniref:hypothetical protein n=1 Tax=Luteibacter anthropi TaxID=564369 RepID=UPI0020324F0B|nr:hypothetical protein [Luteibacter anthropi]URX62082.1 hypothetical protein KR767_18860 [Luteibacter anthropi]